MQACARPFLGKGLVLRPLPEGQTGRQHV